jgi:Flp pilus assembly pilin Flp
VATDDEHRTTLTARALAVLLERCPWLLPLQACWQAARQRLARLREQGERGASVVEYAIIAAIGLGLAIGLGAAITAVVHKYQGQIK